ncbi:MAG: biotin--[acetyl-CoA-carboxylase] ligase [Caulobacteraceae bacterium]
MIVLDEVDSTNAEARRRAEAGARGPLWITAARQTAGRGRRERSWETGDGNLAATLLMPADRSPAEMAQLSFVAALAAADLAKQFVPASLVSLKWPNDTLLAGAKVSGILIEASGGADGGWAAVGIGVNLKSEPREAMYPATTFAGHMRAPPPTPLDALTILAPAFDRWRGLWSREGFEPIAGAWMAMAHGLGEPCKATVANEVVEGLAEGLDNDGAFRIRRPDGQLRRVTAGDVFFGAA